MSSVLLPDKQFSSFLSENLAI